MQVRNEPVVLDRIPFKAEAREVLERLHLDAHGEHAESLRHLIAKASAVARPKAVYRIAFVEQADPDVVLADGVRFTSKVLRGNLDGIGRVFAFLATCGNEMDLLPIDSDDVLAQFCRDTVKEFALRAANAFLNRHLAGRFDITKLTAMHPGSGDATVWPIEQQRELFSLLGDTERLVGVRLTDTCLMLPNKTVSGLYFPAAVDFVTCKLCHRDKCPSRGAPFDPALWAQKMGNGPADDH